MRKMRYLQLIGLVAVAWLLVACGSDVASITATPPPTPTATPTPLPTPTPPLPEPPPATLVVEGQEQISGIGSYCWTEPTGRDTAESVCADMIGIPTVREPLSARTPLTATFELPLSAAPDELLLTVIAVTDQDKLSSEADGWDWWEHLPGDTHRLSPGPQTALSLSPEPGLYLLHLFARWDDHGSVSYGFLLGVEAAAANDSTQEIWSSLSPDGQWLAEGRAMFPARGGQYHTRLTITRRDGTVEWTVVDEWSELALGYTVPRAVRWSADGQGFYFTNRPVPDGCAPFVDGSDLQRVDLRDGSVTQIVPSVGLALTLSPGETTLAYFGYGESGLVLRELASGEEREIPFRREGTVAAGSIVWAPDETALAFTLAWDYCGPPDNATHAILHLDLSTGELETLLEQDPRRLTTADWSADGKLWVVDPAGQYSWLDVATGEMTQLYPEEALTTLTIPEPPLQVRAPQGYALVKNDEAHRRGSFVSYDFRAGDAQPPYFYEIQFFSEASIRDFTSDCQAPCFYGDYPDLARYRGQKAAFEAGSDYEDYRLQRFGERAYFVSNHRCEGDFCVIREYTTFLGDTKVDVWVLMDDTTQVSQSDRLFSAFAIQPAEPPPIQSFEVQLMQALEQRDWVQLQAVMGDIFTTAGWRSEGTAYGPQEAIAQLQTNYLGPDTDLVFDPHKDLTALLDGMDPLAILGPDVRQPSAMFVSGWGLDGDDAFFQANSVKGSWESGQWPGGAKKIDLTVVEGVPADQTLAAFVRELLSNNENRTLESVDDTTAGAHPAVSAVTVSDNDPAEKHTTIALRLAPDKIMLASVLPEGAWTSNDIQGLLSSLAFAPEDMVLLPSFAPDTPIIAVPESCTE